MSSTLTKPSEPRVPRIWDPFRLAREEMESLWSQLVGEPMERRFKGRMMPSLDLSETPNTVEVRMDVPGMKPEDIDIQLANGVLTISGERKEEKEEKGKTFHRIERSYGSFSRSVTVPTAVSEDKVDAQYHNGVLTIALQKTDEAKARKIKVKT
ncbi:MAG TPA: Hsp20/alpha crystallin family protein [Pirellulales bacterium]|nr:Hsp20/alpha crystallin family protein [Pirellulales bacterium]